MTAARRFLVRGWVQGVGFRYATVRTARRLGLVGWVRNLPDGRVEVVAEGDSEAVEELAAWLRRGPSTARVEGVETETLEPTGAYREFTVRF